MVVKTGRHGQQSVKVLSPQYSAIPGSLPVPSTSSQHLKTAVRASYRR